MHQPGRPPSNLTPNNVSMGLLGRSLPPMLINNIPSQGVFNLSSNGPFRDERGHDNSEVGASNPKRVKLSNNENYIDFPGQHQNNFSNIPFNKLNNYIINNNAGLKHKNEAIDPYGINLINLNIINNNNLKLFNNHNLVSNTPPSPASSNNSKVPLQIKTTEVKKVKNI